MKERTPKCLFGKVLYQLMRKAGMTQYELSQKASIKQPLISMYISCRRLPDLLTTVRIARALSLKGDDEYKLYRARLIWSDKQPIWSPKVVSALKSAKLLSKEEVEHLINKGLKGMSILEFAERYGLDEGVLFKMKKLQPVEVMASKRAVVSKYLDKMKLTDEEKASLLLTYLYTHAKTKRKEESEEELENAKKRFVEVLTGRSIEDI